MLFLLGATNIKKDNHYVSSNWIRMKFDRVILLVNRHQVMKSDF